MAILPLFILVNSEYWAKSRRKAIKYLERNRRDEREEEVGKEGKREDEWEWGREWREVMRKGGKISWRVSRCGEGFTHFKWFNLISGSFSFTTHSA